jgi:hypothetical protein
MVNKNCDLLGEVMAMVIWHILLHTSIIAIIQTLFITTGSPPDSLIWGHGNWACKCSKKKELPMCWQKKHAWMARSTPSVACIYICQDWGSFERLDKQQVPQMALTSAVPVLQNKTGATFVTLRKNLQPMSCASLSPYSCWVSTARSKLSNNLQRKKKTTLELIR